MKHPLTLLLVPNVQKTLYFHAFPIQMNGVIGKKHVTFYLGMLVRAFGFEIAYLASPYHHEALKNISDTTFTEH